MVWLTLMFVRIAHDEFLDEGEGMMLVHVWGIAEWVVLFEVLDNVGMQGEGVLVGSVRDWPVGAE